jgi:hypothetical protein
MIDFVRPGLSRRKQGFETPTGRHDFMDFDLVSWPAD